MKKRLDSLTRIGKLQARMHGLGRWRLSSLERQQAGLNDDLRAIFEVLESGDLAYGPQARLAARHVGALQRRLDSLAREQETARRSVVDARDAREACGAGDRNGRPALSTA